ncbi:hypothetical protein GCM10009678_74620 [Actinomadura kijaniata]
MFASGGAEGGLRRLGDQVAGDDRLEFGDAGLGFGELAFQVGGVVLVVLWRGLGGADLVEGGRDVRARGGPRAGLEGRTRRRRRQGVRKPRNVTRFRTRKPSRS